MMSLLAFHSLEEPVGEPAAQGQVVETQRDVCQGDGADIGKHHIGRAFRDGGTMIAHPCRIDIDDGIMGDVERIGDVAQEFANGRGAGARDLSARSHGNNDGEDEENATSLVKPVHPIMVFATEAGQGQDYHYQQGAIPEGASLYPDEPTQAREEQAAEEGIEQAGEAYALLFPRQRPTANHVARRSRQGVAYCKAGSHSHQHRKRTLAEAAYEERVKDIGDILIIK